MPTYFTNVDKKTTNYMHSSSSSLTMNCCKYQIRRGCSGIMVQRIYILPAYFTIPHFCFRFLNTLLALVNYCFVVICTYVWITNKAVSKTYTIQLQHYMFRYSVSFFLQTRKWSETVYVMKLCEVWQIGMNNNFVN